MSLRTTDDPHTPIMTAQTLVEIALEEVEVGAAVAVYGPLSQNDRTLIADAVVALPARQP